jgi:hypothetical protein
MKKQFFFSYYFNFLCRVHKFYVALYQLIMSENGTNYGSYFLDLNAAIGKKYTKKKLI